MSRSIEAQSLALGVDAERRVHENVFGDLWDVVAEEGDLVFDDSVGREFKQTLELRGDAVSEALVEAESGGTI